MTVFLCILALIVVADIPDNVTREWTAVVGVALRVLLVLGITGLAVVSYLS